MQCQNKYDNILISGNLTSFHFYLLTPHQNRERGPSLKMKQQKLNQGTLIFSFYFISQEKRSIQQLSTDIKSHQIEQMANHNQKHECCVPSGWCTDEPDSLTGGFEFIHRETEHIETTLIFIPLLLVSHCTLRNEVCVWWCWGGGVHSALGILIRTHWIRRNKPYDTLAHAPLNCHTVHARTFLFTISHTVSVRWSCGAHSRYIQYEIRDTWARKAN